ncbi:hypothetical protein KOW79_008177 [Hemibagrus wyckioides]|uniref:Uncharacterized protein n=1 Tax=Hemibagrus wyckioides TaxID=337641 RepID=A0A9D3SQW9_9TELE|nr:hypothetical protein KOW79_008177 [Hemibagrus wyckioides]
MQLTDIFVKTTEMRASQKMKGDEETKTQAQVDSDVEVGAEESSSKEKERKKRTRRGTRGRGKKKVQLANGHRAQVYSDEFLERFEVLKKPVKVLEMLEMVLPSVLRAFVSVHPFRRSPRRSAHCAVKPGWTHLQTCKEAKKETAQDVTCCSVLPKQDQINSNRRPACEPSLPHRCRRE